MSEAHDLWRKAALENRRQFYGIRDPLSRERIREDVEYSYERLNTNAYCGVTLLSYYASAGLMNRFSTMKITFDCGCEQAMKEATVHQWIVHLNNVHQWDWLDFANKFPEIE